MANFTLVCQRCKSQYPDCDLLEEWIDLEITKGSHLRYNFCPNCETEKEQSMYEEWICSEPLYVDNGSSKVNPNQLSLFEEWKTKPHTTNTDLPERVQIVLRG